MATLTPHVKMRMEGPRRRQRGSQYSCPGRDAVLTAILFIQELVQAQAMPFGPCPRASLKLIFIFGDMTSSEEDRQGFDGCAASGSHVLVSLTTVLTAHPTLSRPFCSHLFAVKVITALRGLNVGPQKACPRPNLWSLRMGPYLEKRSLQM